MVVLDELLDDELPEEEEAADELDGVEDEALLLELEDESDDFELDEDESELPESAFALVLLPDSERLSVR